MNRKGMIKRIQRLRANIDQTFLDAEHWNRINPNEEPIDPDPDGELHRLATRLDATLAVERRRGMKVVPAPPADRPTEDE